MTVKHVTRALQLPGAEILAESYLLKGDEFTGMCDMGAL